MLRVVIKSVLPRRFHRTLAESYAFFRSLPYCGRRRHCVCCGGSFRKFLSQGVPGRPNVRCPRCNSLERHRLLWLYLKEKTDLTTAPLRVLHFAPEPSLERRLRRLKNLREYVATDLDSPYAMVRSDITNLPWGDDSVDVVLCNHVLEHVPDDRKALLEIRRVLAPDGWAVLQVPLDLSKETTEEDPKASPEERTRRFGQSDHVRLYGADYPERLEEAGFEVTMDLFVSELSEETTARMSLDREEILFVVRNSDEEGFRTEDLAQV